MGLRVSALAHPELPGGVVKDKRDECGCHKGCAYEPHTCEKPCVWPECLTPEESAELVEEISKELW